MDVEQLKLKRLKGIYSGMKQRCTNPRASSYEWYGGKGIKVCERWQEFENFYADMSSTYEIGLTIDRIDGNGNYEPNNCRWLTRSENSKNKLPVPPRTEEQKRFNLKPHSTKIRKEQKAKLQKLADKWGISKNAVIIKLIDKARV